MSSNLGDKDTNLVWIDLEMTGLNLDKDQIIEIATIITDKDLNILAKGPVLAIQTPKELLDSMDDVVREMHTKNGLIERVKASTTTLAQAEEQTLAFIQQYTNVRTSPLCGNSIGTDKMFLTKYMPKIVAHLHYRLIDVSTVKQLNFLWGFNYEYEKKGTHLALDDIEESIGELNFYRDKFFKKN
ncbi:oligoribonuclease [Psittacicella melopsittaci]|uniref:Oligoribonuclease n=1 Tax=Psittacicella melopsittaci TaxID=2028576 RepID=A0A3A1Y196_9GAMM|nr:oligoribonuclease [Psittacicella melopsittaci]RIY31231.1 oligoribonuclease [Psittacicella melopsittaci]